MLEESRPYYKAKKGEDYYNTKNRSDDRYTPPWLYGKLNSIYQFTTDPCTDPKNRLGTKVHYTKNYGPAGDGNGLVAPWYGNVFINPPYGAKSTPYWVRAARDYANKNGGNYVVMLLKNTNDVQWFHNYIWDKEQRRFRDGVDVDFIEGRVNFLDKDGKEMDAAPFGSMIVEFHKPGTPSKLTGWYKNNPEASGSRKMDEF
jgi:hypothetical protein